MQQSDMDRREKVLDYDKMCEEYIKLMYTGTSGFISYMPGETEEAEKQKVYLTYGEILYPSFNKVIDYIGDITEDDVFYDFGSGIGKVGLQFFLKTPARKVVGIEANKKRNDVCVKVYDKVKEEFPEAFKNRELNCMQRSFLDVDVTDATIIYACSTLFAPELLYEIGRVVDRCPKIRYLFSIPSVKYDWAHIPCKLPHQTTTPIDCTWDKTKFYAYHVDPRPAEENQAG